MSSDPNQDAIEYHAEFYEAKIVQPCETCGGDGKETCNNPDHGFLDAMSFHDIERIGCPVCGHDPNHKVKNGGKCEDCDGTGVKKS